MRPIITIFNYIHNSSTSGLAHAGRHSRPMLMSGIELRSWLELKSGLGLRLGFGLGILAGLWQGKFRAMLNYVSNDFCQLYKRYLII